MRRENFQKKYLTCLANLYKNKTFETIQENIQNFIDAMTPLNITLREKLTNFFLLLVPIPISRGVSSENKPPTQLVLDTIPLFSFILSRGKIDLQAGKDKICFEMPLTRTIRECLALLSKGKVPARSERIFEEDLLRFCEFCTYFYDQKIGNEIIRMIKDASTLLSLLLVGEKNKSNVDPKNLKTAFLSLRSILFRMSGIEWLTIERLSKFQRGLRINELTQWPIFTVEQENKLKAYFNQQLRKSSQKNFMTAPSGPQSLDALLFKSFVSFSQIKQLQESRNNGSSVEHNFTEFQQICQQSTGTTFFNTISNFSEVIPSPEAFNVLIALKKRISEYIQLSKEQKSVLLDKY
ncbi:MAG: hypothetical protein ACFFDT_40280, partial [Candidatus Hodarchaeota archaeon]